MACAAAGLRWSRDSRPRASRRCGAVQRNLSIRMPARAPARSAGYAGRAGQWRSVPRLRSRRDGARAATPGGSVFGAGRQGALVRSRHACARFAVLCHGSGARPGAVGQSLLSQRRLAGGLAGGGPGRVLVFRYRGDGRAASTRSAGRWFRISNRRAVGHGARCRSGSASHRTMARLSALGRKPTAARD